MVDRYVDWFARYQMGTHLIEWALMVLGLAVAAGLAYWDGKKGGPDYE